MFLNSYVFSEGSYIIHGVARNYAFYLMNIRYKILLAAAFLNTSASAQDLLAHWDFNDGATNSQSLIAEQNINPYVIASDVVPVGLGFSFSTRDSEDDSNFGANCFSGWNDPGPNFVSFEVTTAANTFGSLSNLNFDIANFGGANDPTQFQVTVLQNGMIVSQSSFLDITATAVQNNGGSWTGSSDQNFDLSGLSATQGTSDVFEFRISANQGAGLVALDNIRLTGDLESIPEPATTLLGSLAAIGLMLRRRR